MTRTDVMASSRPRKQRATSMSRGSTKAPRARLLLAAFLLALALGVPSAASAVEGTTGYGQTPTPPTTSTSGTTPTQTTTTTGTTPTSGTAPTTTGYKQTPTAPSAGTSPSKEKSTPASSTGAETSGSAPAKSANASTLPFTGFDLRWTIAIGLLLIGIGLSIVAVQRRQRSNSGR
jgi:cytoskeletal protein RodZ